MNSTDDRIQALQRDLARSGNFPLGLKGRRVRIFKRASVFDWALPEGTRRWRELLPPWEATVLDTHVWALGNATGGGLFLMLDDGKVLCYTFSHDDLALEIIG